MLISLIAVKFKLELSFESALSRVYRAPLEREEERIVRREPRGVSYVLSEELPSVRDVNARGDGESAHGLLSLSFLKSRMFMA